MHKDLIFVAAMATAFVTGGCSMFGGSDGSTAGSDSGWSLVHRPTIQQGNVLTQQMLDNLQPGMSRDQVRFLLGTPSLVDVFHADRWDYVYRLKKPGAEPVQKRLTLFFENDLLARVEGEYPPGVEGEAGDLEEVLVEVPDHDGSKGIVTRSLEAVGLKDAE